MFIDDDDDDFEDADDDEVNFKVGFTVVVTSSQINTDGMVVMMAMVRVLMMVNLWSGWT